MPLEDLNIHRRQAWGADLSPTGPLSAERPEDVRFLLIHHSASANSYSAEQVPDILRGFFRTHTGTKGWPDVAYNFFVDRFGGIWEGRMGSLDRPVKADATGGSQGFAMLCCFIGDHRDVPPTPRSIDAMVALVAVLADRYGVDTRPGSTTSFISRGSNKWPAGVRVTTPTIAAHRDMSLTVCPGDAAYALVRDELPRAVTARRGPPATPTRSPTPAGTRQPRPTRLIARASSPPDDGLPILPVVLGVPGAAVVAAIAGAIVLRRRNRQSE